MPCARLAALFFLYVSCAHAVVRSRAESGSLTEAVVGGGVGGSVAAVTRSGVLLRMRVACPDSTNRHPFSVDGGRVYFPAASEVQMPQQPRVLPAGAAAANLVQCVVSGTRPAAPQDAGAWTVDGVMPLVWDRADHALPCGVEMLVTRRGFRGADFERPPTIGIARRQRGAGDDWGGAAEIGRVAVPELPASPAPQLLAAPVVDLTAPLPGWRRVGFSPIAARARGVEGAVENLQQLRRLTAPFLGGFEDGIVAYPFASGRGGLLPRSALHVVCDGVRGDDTELWVRVAAQEPNPHDDARQTLVRPAGL